MRINRRDLFVMLAGLCVAKPQPSSRIPNDVWRRLDDASWQFHLAAQRFCGFDRARGRDVSRTIVIDTRGTTFTEDHCAKTARLSAAIRDAIKRQNRA